jgi:putative addiction module component (TIGR02574 family)
MPTSLDEVLDESLKLGPMERAKLVEQILASFEFPERKQIDELWAQEAEDRLEANERGEIQSTPARKVFDGVDRGKSRFSPKKK